MLMGHDYDDDGQGGRAENVHIDFQFKGIPEFICFFFWDVLGG